MAPEYNGDYFTTEPTINVIHHTRLTADGSSYKAARLPGREQTEFIRSRDMWWRPIEVRVSPDGAMYVADFYNQAVIHNDTRGPDHNRVNAAVRPDRDHFYGRIWKIEHKQAKKLTVPDLSKVGPDELIAQLDSSNRPVRMTASRLLVEHAETLPADRRGNLRLNFAQNTRAAWPNLNADAKIARMWTLYRIGATGEEFPVYRFLANDDPAVRRNASLILEAQFLAAGSGTKPSLSPAVTEALAKALTDPDASLRLAALRAIAAGQSNDQLAKTIVSSWRRLDDDFQRSAAVGAVTQNPVAVISAILDTPQRRCRSS
jgi:hypothetical protein